MPPPLPSRSSSAAAPARSGRGYHLLRVAIGALFVYASWEKILDPGGFAVAVANYRILPALLVPATALLLPWVEMLCGLLLLGNRLVAGSILIVDTLMAIFILALVSNFVRGLDVACGCFTLAEKGGGNMALYLVRDVLILAAGLRVLVCAVRTRAGGNGHPA